MHFTGIRPRGAQCSRVALVVAHRSAVAIALPLAPSMRPLLLLTVLQLLVGFRSSHPASRLPATHTTAPGEAGYSSSFEVPGIPGVTTAPVTWHVDPLTVRVAADQRQPLPSSAPGVDIAAQMGEYEEQQLWIVAPPNSDLRNITIGFATLRAVGSGRGATLAATYWSYFQVGFVSAERPMYNCSSSPATAKPSPPGTPSVKRGGHGCKNWWHADAMLPVPPEGVPIVLRNTTQPLVLQLHVPRRSEGGHPGNFTGAFVVRGFITGPSSNSAPFSFDVPVQVEVWPIELPYVGQKGAFTTIFSFEDESLHEKYHPDWTQSQLWAKYLPFLSSYRITGDNIYLSHAHNGRTLQNY
eukprot:COSAG05_NODE_4593_length_1435_cov_1.854815_1_plen_353_part_01